VLELPPLPDPPRLPDDAIDDELLAFVRVDAVPELRNGLLLSGIYKTKNVTLKKTPL
jgi:hypothetical protein